MAVKNLLETISIFLEKSPQNVDADRFKTALYFNPLIKGIHHLHIWTMDGNTNYATIHVVSNSENMRVLKEKIRKSALEHNIQHITIEVERNEEKCVEINCKPTKIKKFGCACHGSNGGISFNQKQYAVAIGRN